MLRMLLLVGLTVSFVGCGAQVEEKPPLEEAGEVMPQDQAHKAMKESMEKGGYGQRYKVPGQKTQ
jgi:hypothetical protein